jgi:ADP-ribose pyrophosphatase YjhB (NUDIX family)
LTSAPVRVRIAVRFCIQTHSQLNIDTAIRTLGRISIMSSFRVPEPSLLLDINTLIGAEISAAPARVGNAGRESKIIENKPVATISAYPYPSSDHLCGDDEEPFIAIGCDTDRYKFRRGPACGYIDSWSTWPAYKKVVALLKQQGWNDPEIRQAIPMLFEYRQTYGVLAMVSHQTTHRILMGVRGSTSAGSYVGCLSFPGGLVHPGESLRDAVLRQTEEAGVCGTLSLRQGFAFGLHHSAPSVTFMCAAETATEEIRTSYKWERRRLIWVPHRAVSELLFLGSNRGVLEAFRKADINVPDTLKLAPDALSPAQNVMHRHV